MTDKPQAFGGGVVSAVNPTHIDVIARALADTADDGCFNNPPTYDDEGFLDLDVDLDEWNSGEEDREYWTKLARASVSKLTDAGYSIVQVTKVLGECGDKYPLSDPALLCQRDFGHAGGHEALDASCDRFRWPNLATNEGAVNG